jgi:FMN-dependent NADH-azoreductase
MATLLHVDSSARQSTSVSRQLSTSLVAHWQRHFPNGRVIVRDLAASPLPHVTEAQVGAYFTPAEQRTDEQKTALILSDQLVDELLEADTIVIGAPMYNFSVPSSLKSWIDHVARLGRTFGYTDKGPVGLATGKRVFVALSSGGIYSEGAARVADFESGYLKQALGFIGLTDVRIIAAEGVALGEDVAKQAIAKAESQIAAIS